MAPPEEEEEEEEEPEPPEQPGTPLGGAVLPGHGVQMASMSDLKEAIVGAVLEAVAAGRIC